MNVKYEGDKYYARGGLRTGGEERVTELGRILVVLWAISIIIEKGHPIGLFLVRDVRYAL